jgi:hypothetical protein
LGSSETPNLLGTNLFRRGKSWKYSENVAEERKGLSQLRRCEPNEHDKGDIKITTLSFPSYKRSLSGFGKQARVQYNTKVLNERGRSI